MHNPNITTCDNCDASFNAGARIVICRARPSDPAELSAVMWFCPACKDEAGPFYIDKSGAVGDYDFIAEQFENGVANALGYLWMTI